MAIQLTASGDALANNTATGVNFVNTVATAPVSITCWINAPWGTGIQSYVGLYDEKQRVASGTNTSTAIQLGSKTSNTFNVWTWGGGILVDSTISMAPHVNQWCFIAYTFDGTTHRCYVNGVLGGSTTNAQQPGNFDRVYINGYTNGGASETATFKVDTYNSYSRALTQNEIITMYNTRGNRHGIVHNRLVSYEFDELAPGVTSATIYNQTELPAATSNLITVTPAGTTRVTFVAGYADANLRPPQG